MVVRDATLFTSSGATVCCSALTWNSIFCACSFTLLSFVFCDWAAGSPISPDAFSDTLFSVCASSDAFTWITGAASSVSSSGCTFCVSSVVWVIWTVAAITVVSCEVIVASVCGAISCTPPSAISTVSLKSAVSSANWFCNATHSSLEIPSVSLKLWTNASVFCIIFVNSSLISSEQASSVPVSCVTSCERLAGFSKSIHCNPSIDIASSTCSSETPSSSFRISFTPVSNASFVSSSWFCSSSTFCVGEFSFTFSFFALSATAAGCVVVAAGSFPTGFPLVSCWFP